MKAVRLALQAWLALFLLCAGSAQARTPDDGAPQISLLTFGPGEIYWERFGHNALLVRDASGLTHVYNYGMFDFAQENFFLNFARGKMDYWLAEFPLDFTLRAYAHQQRWVYEQVLNLDLTERVALAEFLAWNVQPENAGYRYDYFRDNCSTRVRDAIDRVLGGALRAQLEAQATDRSYRIEALRLMSPQPALMLGMDAVMGPAPNQPINLWQQSFVPMILMDAVSEMQYRAHDGSQKPLVRTAHWLLRAETAAAPARPPSYLMVFAGFGLVLAALLLLLAHLRRYAAARISFAVLGASLALCGGLGGVVLLAAWGLSDHWAMWANQNLLLFNPLWLLVLPSFIASLRPQWQPGPAARLLVMSIVTLGVGALLWKLLPLPQQANAIWIALWLPAQLALGWIIARRWN